MSNEFEYKFIDEFKYQSGGEQIFATHLILKAPGNKHRFQFASLQKVFMDAVGIIKEQNPDSNSAENQEGSSEFDGEQIIGMLMLSRLDLGKMYESFNELLRSQGICMIDGTVQMTKYLLEEKLSALDTQTLMGEYFSNFLVPSFLTSQIKKK